MSGAAFKLLSFVAAFLLGIAVLVLFREEKATGVGALLVVIFGYAVAGLIRHRGAEREAHGDAVYYLGFCLTLVSLSIGLIHFDAKAGTTTALITTFGYGILATVCGLVLRILIQNFIAAPEPEPAEEGLRRLNEGYQALGMAVEGAVGGITDSMNAFRERATRIAEGLAEEGTAARRALHEACAEERRAATEEIRKAASESIGAISGLAERALAGLDAVAGESRAAAAAAREAVAEGAGRFTEGAEAMGRAARALTETGAQVEALSARVGEALAALSRTTAQLQEGATAVVTPFRELAGSHHSFAGISAAAASTEGHLREILRAVEGLAALAATAQRDAEAASREVSRLAGRLQGDPLATRRL